jgi:hypothetical protein
MSQHEATIQQIRAIAGDVAARAMNDGGYRASLEADPVGVLRTAGVPEEAMGDLLRDFGIESSDVSGYLLELGVPINAATCTFTCLWTCPASEKPFASPGFGGPGATQGLR